MVKLQFTSKDKRHLSQNVGQAREKAKFILIFPSVTRFAVRQIVGQVKKILYLCN